MSKKIKIKEVIEKHDMQRVIKALQDAYKVKLAPKNKDWLLKANLYVCVEDCQFNAQTILKDWNKIKVIQDGKQVQSKSKFDLSKEAIVVFEGYTYRYFDEAKIIVLPEDRIFYPK